MVEYVALARTAVPVAAALVGPAVHRDAAALGPDVGDRLAEQQFSAAGGNVIGQRAGHGAIVDDRRRRRVQRRHAAHVRLDLAQRVRFQPGDPGHAVRLRAGLQVAQPLDLHRVPGDYDLADLAVLQALLAAEFAQQFHSATAEHRLERTRLVVEPRVHDAGVAAGLVGGDLGLLLEDGHLVPAHLGQPAGHREAQDPGPNDADPPTTAVRSWCGLPWNQRLVSCSVLAAVFLPPGYA